jgi:hypothetical protein
MSLWSLPRYVTKLQMMVSNKIQFYFPCYNMINSLFFLNVHQRSHSKITLFTLYEKHPGKGEEQKQESTN